MLDPSRQPVIVGVADLRSNRQRTVEDAREPLDLMEDAARAAGRDSGVPGLLRELDAIDVVNIISWAYTNPGIDLAARLGAQPSVLNHCAPGGNRPVELLDRAAGRIAAGGSRVALVTGAEAAASFVACMKSGAPPAWSTSPGGPAYPDKADHCTPLMLRYGIEMPIYAYPMYENALRARLGQSLKESQDWSAQMYADFSRVAAGHEAAWDPAIREPAEIAVVSERNRMICHPYPLFMNANLMTDQASAVLVTSVAVAREHGIHESKLVHVWGGAGRSDSPDLLQRPSYARSVAMAEAFDAAFAQTGIGARDIEAWDLYSCFPVVPKLASLELNLPRGTPLTQTGGLTSFGGPANNYSGHAVVHTAEAVRRGARRALVYGNGELVTKHSVVILGSSAPEDGWRGDPDVRQVSSNAVEVRDEVRGAATLETFTVEYARSGQPKTGLVIARDSSGARFPALVKDRGTLAILVDHKAQPVGLKGKAGQLEDGRTSFNLLSESGR